MMTPPHISFEVFPPKTPDASARLDEALSALAPLDPAFVSVTYGAGGTTRTLTHDTAARIQNRHGLDVAAHLTCVGASRDATLAVADAYWRSGVREIVALRGDPPKGVTGFVPHPDGFASSAELVEALAATGRFRIRVGAYPDRHPEAASNAADIDYLKRKIDAGAHAAITQFFFEAETFLRFRDSCARAGIDAPIIPGIMPIENWTRVRKFARACGARIPQWLDTAYGEAERAGRTADLSQTLCREMCAKLRAGGVDHFHFYTLNKPGPTRDLCHALGLGAKTAQAHDA